MARHFTSTSSELIAVNAQQIAQQGTAFSVALWARAPAVVGSGFMYGEGRSSTNNPLFEIAVGSSSAAKVHPVFFLRNDANSTRLNYTMTASPFADGNWHFIGYAQDASNNVAVYSDTTKETTSYTTSGTLTIDRSTIGALVRASASNWWNGDIAHLAIFNRQLSAAEMLSLANGMLPSHLGPVHYWPLLGVDSPEPDIGIGTHVAGTLSGTTFAAGGRTSKELIAL